MKIFFNSVAVEIFDDVARHLGNGWRVDKRVPFSSFSRLNLINPNFKGYLIQISPKDPERVEIGICPVSGNNIRNIKHARCCATISKKTTAIANDINKKIIPELVESETFFIEKRGEASERKERAAVFKNILNKICPALTPDYSGGFSCYVDKLLIKIDEPREREGILRHSLKITGLDTDQLLKISALVNQFIQDNATE
ncbi:MAG: hypothetical protein ACRC9N_11150 [Aeromonas sp.]